MDRDLSPGATCVFCGPVKVTCLFLCLEEPGREVSLGNWAVHLNRAGLLDPTA